MGESYAPATSAATTSLKDGLCEKLDALLRGAEDNKEALRERLGGLDLSEYVRDLWLDELLDALYPART